MASHRMCEVCKQPIEPERAEGFPNTRLCGAHARLIEKYGGEFTVRASQEKTSKAGSLKLNYGGISTSQTRNQEGVRRLREEYERESLS